ncbi:N-methyl-L-tryptophan oxidase [Salinicoccus albus]|uniref:N-methyl-L-tryptophan oxidase n=1 Tax=Salinicoccus albus TaxID=418756 RepID=UPI00037BFFF3|nr:N-methyl-L-tryptophan oxidase [Salinicoccus albus]
MKLRYDVIVLGAGAMGMAAGYYLSQKGVNTLMIDAFDPPHSRGSHHGDTRLIRHATGEGSVYAPIAVRSQQLWNELAEQTDETIFRRTGVLTFGENDADFVRNAISAGLTIDTPVETLSGKEIHRRWPGIRLPEDSIGSYEPKAGVLFSENCIRAYRRLALENGAELLTHAPVTNVDVKEDYVTVQTEHGVYSADKLIVSGGAWNKKILEDLNLNISIYPSRRTIAWFDADDSLYNSEDFPGFIGKYPEGQYYGFPSFDGGGVKIGRYDDGEFVDPDQITIGFGAYDKDERDLRDFLEEYMPGAAGDLNMGKACMFTNTPDRDFVVDFHPGHSNVVIAAGFSGHGFKFASGIGEILSDLVTEGQTDMDISKFSAQRPVLYQESTEAG